jgi:hypothetical protein
MVKVVKYLDGVHAPTHPTITCSDASCSAMPTETVAADDTPRVSLLLNSGCVACAAATPFVQHLLHKAQSQFAHEKKLQC